jgi:Flp pilus assembly protein CpaB
VARDIVPGQQLTAADLQLAAGDIRTKLSGDERALGIPGDAVRTLNGTLRAGDRVDMLVGVNADDRGVGRAVVRHLISDVLVLSVPGAPVEGQASGSGGEAITLRVAGKDVSRVASAVAHAQTWLVIRPGAGAKELPVAAATLDQVLAGRKPVAAEDAR